VEAAINVRGCRVALWSYSNNLANGEATAPMHQLDRRFARGRPGNGQRINGI